METGLTQGAPLSRLVFNVATAEYANRVRAKNPDVNIVAQHDEYYILGEPLKAMDALNDLTAEFKSIGLELLDKNVIRDNTSVIITISTMSCEVGEFHCEKYFPHFIFPPSKTI
jgi:hypothetical protein